MLPEYQRKADRAAAVWFASVAVLIGFVIVARMTGFAAGDRGLTVFLVLVAISFLVLGYAAWAYGKAKGYSGVVAILLVLLLHLLGLIILLCLKDKHKQPPAAAAPVG